MTITRLILICLMFGVGCFTTGWALATRQLVFYNQPYSITVDNPTVETSRMCQKDPYCQDIYTFGGIHD